MPGFPTGWTVSGNILAQTRNISAFALGETRFAHTGRHSLRVSVPWDTHASTVVEIPGVLVKKGAHVTVSAWARVYVASMCSPLRVVDSAGAVVGAPMTISVGAWAQISTSGAVTTDGGIGFSCGSGGTFYIDDVSVEGATSSGGGVAADGADGIGGSGGEGSGGVVVTDGHGDAADASGAADEGVAVADSVGGGAGAGAGAGTGTLAVGGAADARSVEADVVAMVDRTVYDGQDTEAVMTIRFSGQVRTHFSLQECTHACVCVCRRW
jgi:hypothetical protein